MVNRLPAFKFVIPQDVAGGKHKKDHSLRGVARSGTTHL
jgi:hypothetical protein